MRHDKASAWESYVRGINTGIAHHTCVCASLKHVDYGVCCVAHVEIDSEKITMLSVRNPGKVYPVSEDVFENDIDTDVEEYNYDGKFVFRGNLDLSQSTDKVHVYWLYNNDSKRVGLVEHCGDEHTCLWYRNNVFSTLLQEDWEAQDKTLWSLMSQAAYEDCMKHGWTTVQKVAERTHLPIVTISDIVNGFTPAEKCSRCMGKKQKGCLVQTKTCSFDIYSTVFVDDDGVIYTPPSDTSIYATLRARRGLAPDDDSSAGTSGTEVWVRASGADGATLGAGT